MNELIGFFLSITLATIFTVIGTVALILGVFWIWDKSTRLLEMIS